MDHIQTWAKLQQQVGDRLGLWKCCSLGTQEIAAKNWGEKYQHPEHFKFISYIFIQLNQVQKQKKKKKKVIFPHFPCASPCIGSPARCLSSSHLVLIIIDSEFLSVAHRPGPGIRGSHAPSFLAKTPPGECIHHFHFLKGGNWCLAVLGYFWARGSESHIFWRQKRNHWCALLSYYWNKEGQDIFRFTDTQASLTIQITCWT